MLARGRWVSRWLVSILVIICLLPERGAANIGTRFIELPAQPLEQSLYQISEHYDRSLVIRQAALSEGRLAPSLRGRYTLDKALQLLLTGTTAQFDIRPAGIVISAQPREELYGPEQVTVTGVRESLTLSRNVKRDRLVIAEAVVAEDLARYPDLNLAESLQRVPGMTITREAGEGRQISLRGGLPDFTLVTLNGMPVLANSDSPMDSREQQQRDRSFDFNIFTSEFFQRIDIDKGYSADQTAGGLTGTVALQTARPFDHAGFHLSITPQVGMNSHTETPTTRLSGLVSNSGEHWGALMALSYSERHAEEQGANTFRWRNLAVSPAVVSGLDVTLSEPLEAGEVFVPRGNRYSVWQSDQRRATLGLALQYQSDTHDMTLDGIFGRFDLDRREDHIYSRGDQLTPLTDHTRMTDAVINHQKELIYASYEGARIATESRVQDVATDYQQWVWQYRSSWNSGLDTRLLLGTERSGFAIPFSHKVYAETETALTVDYREDRYYPQVHYGADLGDPQLWRMSEIDLQSYRADSRFDHAEAALSTFVEPLSVELETGLELNRFSNQESRREQDDVLADVWASDPVASQLVPSLTEVVSEHQRLDWLGFRVNRALTYYGVSPTLSRDDPAVSSVENGIEETTTAWFAQARWQGDSLDMSAGVRFQDYQAELDGDHDTPGSSSRTDDQFWLPAFNARWRGGDGWVARLGLSRNMACARMEELTPQLNVRNDGTVSGLNRALDPYLSRNIDLSFERYWAERSLASIGVFHKNIERVPAPTALSAGERPDGIEQGVGYRNREDMTLKGVELALQTDIAQLPWTEGVMGMTGHYTSLDGAMTYYNEHTAEALFRKRPPYLSRHSGSLTLYAEAERWSARLAATYRGRYRARVDSDTLADENETGFLSSWYLDAIASYRLNDQLELKLEMFNLGNEREVQYSDTAKRAYNTARSGRTLLFGVIFRFQ